MIKSKTTWNTKNMYFENGKPIYYAVEYYFNGTVHEMKIGKQIKRARDTAKRMLSNLLVEKVDIVYYLDGFSSKFVESIVR